MITGSGKAELLKGANGSVRPGEKKPGKREGICQRLHATCNARTVDGVRPSKQTSCSDIPNGGRTLLGRGSALPSTEDRHDGDGSVVVFAEAQYPFRGDNKMRRARQKNLCPDQPRVPRMETHGQGAATVSCKSSSTALNFMPFEFMVCARRSLSISAY